MEKCLILVTSHPGQRAVITSPNIQTEDGELLHMAGGNFPQRAPVPALNLDAVKSQNKYPILQTSSGFFTRQNQSLYLIRGRKNHAHDRAGPLTPRAGHYSKR